MKTKNIIIIQLIFLVVNANTRNYLYSQVSSENVFLKWASWTILQSLPSLTFYEDRLGSNSTLRTGLQWQVIPISYTFKPNKYLSNLNFFYIKPVKRFSGCAELYYEPEYIFGGFKYAPIKSFMFKSGCRAVFPLTEKGEYLSFSIGAGINYEKHLSGDTKYSASYELALYSFFGMLGAKFNYNPNSLSKYSFGMYIKYY